MVKKSAFTLVEILIALIIFMITVGAMVPTLTKVKPQIESVGIRGQYGCWWEEDVLYEQYFDERTPRTPKQDVTATGCKLLLDQRPANFYMIGVGAGSDISDGKLVIKYTPGLSNELEITAGKYVDSEDSEESDKKSQTIISSGAQPELIAASGQIYSRNSALIGENLLNQCTIDYSACGGTRCTVEELIKKDYLGNVISRNYAARIEGGSCVQEDVYGNPSENNIVYLDNCTLKNGISEQIDLDKITDSQIPTLTSNNDVYYQCLDVANRQQNLEFHFIDSSYMQAKYMLDFVSNDVFETSINDAPRFARMIKFISSRRKSALTEYFSNSDFGAIKNDGAVLILW